MKNTANEEIRTLLKLNKVPVYAVAHCMGVHENTLFRMLRYELPDDIKQNIIRIIEVLSDQA